MQPALTHVHILYIHVFNSQQNLDLSMIWIKVYIIAVYDNCIIQTISNHTPFKHLILFLFNIIDNQNWLKIHSSIQTGMS